MRKVFESPVLHLVKNPDGAPAEIVAISALFSSDQTVKKVRHVQVKVIVVSTQYVERDQIPGIFQEFTMWKPAPYPT